MKQGEVKQINGKRVASPEYRSWQMMRNRMSNPNAMDAKYYQGTGLTIEPRWAVFAEFLKDMGRKPTPQHTLERVDNSIGYLPGNCIWATRQTQARNRPAYLKLSLAEAGQIRDLYAYGGYRQVDLAALYGINQTEVSQIIRNVTWKK